MLAGSYAERVRRYYHEAFVARNWDYLRQLIAPHASVPDGGGAEAKIAALGAALAGFTDVSIDIHHLVECGNQVAVHFVFNATDTGGFMGRPPTRLRLSAWGVEFWRFEGEQVVEDWAGVDYLGMFIQLGVVPSPWPAATSA
jgi:predicted ester cyclase